MSKFAQCQTALVVTQVRSYKLLSEAGSRPCLLPPSHWACSRGMDPNLPAHLLGRLSHPCHTLLICKFFAMPKTQDNVPMCKEEIPDGISERAELPFEKANSERKRRCISRSNHRDYYSTEGSRHKNASSG